jgi:hypothetical protein
MIYSKLKKNNLCKTALLVASAFIIFGCGDQHSEKFSSLPENYKVIDCTGGIESINAKRISPVTSIGSDKNLVINGWAVLNVNEGITFDKVQLSITDSQGHIVRYSTFKTKRDDVSTYFNQGLDDAGFTTFIQAAPLKGIVDIGVIGIKGNQYYLCKNMNQKTDIQ